MSSREGLEALEWFRDEIDAYGQDIAIWELVEAVRLILNHILEEQGAESD